MVYNGAVRTPELVVDLTSYVLSVVLFCVS